MTIEDLMKQRLSTLAELDMLSEAKIESTIPYQAIGRRLEINITAIRALRVAPAPPKPVYKPKVSQSEKLKITESEGAKMTQVITVDLYHDFKAQGMTDKAIREKVGLDNNKFYRFKQDNGLIKPGAKTPVVQEARPVMGDKEIKALVTESDRLSTLENELNDFKSQLADAISFIESLKVENAALNEQLWGNRLQVLYAKQAELENFIAQKHGIDVLDYLEDQQLSILVELAESANEWQGFKYWKQNKAVDRDKVLEETVDVLHLITARGIAKGWKVSKLVSVKRSTITQQYLALIQTIVTDAESEETYATAFNLYAGLVEMLGFMWLEIEAAYAKKHQENIDRQNNDY